MGTMRVTPEKPPEIHQGLEEGKLKQIGGVIVDAAKQEALAFVREAYDIVGEEFVKDLTAGVALSAANAATFNLAISTMGFGIVIKRLGAIEHELRRLQEQLGVVNFKVDLSFYSNFRAAVDLASNSFSMYNAEMRKASALQAVNRLLEAEHHYLRLADLEIADRTQVAESLLATLSLAYVAETRCYLELEELDTALQRLRDGAALLKPRYIQHIRTLLTPNPAAYLHPVLKDSVDLRRLTRVFQWLRRSQLDENAVFQELRRDLFDLAADPKKWMQSLPPAVYMPRPGFLERIGRSASSLRKMPADELRAMASTVQGWLNRVRHTGAAEPGPADLSLIVQRLGDCLTLIEQLIEDFNRLEMYQLEIQKIKDLRLSFRDWRNLGAEHEPTKERLLYIVPSAVASQVA